MLVFRFPIAYGTQNSYEKRHIPSRSTVADESTPQSSQIGLGLGTSAPQEEPCEIYNKKTDDSSCAANAQGSTELPGKYESSLKEDSDSRSLNRKSDINWRISGGKFPAVDIFNKLRAKRTTMPMTTEDSNEKAPIHGLNQPNPLKSARITSLNAQGDVARPVIMDSPALLSTIALVW